MSKILLVSFPLTLISLLMKGYFCSYYSTRRHIFRLLRTFNHSTTEFDSEPFRMAPNLRSKAPSYFGSAPSRIVTDKEEDAEDKYKED
jgi:hypothetical protein